MTHGEAMREFDKLVCEFAEMGFTLQRGIKESSPGWESDYLVEEDKFFVLVGSKVFFKCHDVSDLRAISGFVFRVRVDKLRVESEPGRVLRFWGS